MSFPSDEQASELRDLFFESAEEILQGMNEAGLALEEHPGDAEHLRHVRRAVHTLKGDSAACGYRAMRQAISILMTSRPERLWGSSLSVEGDSQARTTRAGQWGTCLGGFRRG